MGLLDQWNKNKFSIYKSEEKTVLKLLEEISKWLETTITTLDNKTDLCGDHKGSWQGLNRPTLSEEGLRATVEKIVDEDLPTINSSLDTIAKNKWYFEKEKIEGETFSETINKIINKATDGDDVIIPKGTYNSNGSLMVDKFLKFNFNNSIVNHTSTNYFIEPSFVVVSGFEVENLNLVMELNSDYKGIHLNKCGSSTKLKNININGGSYQLFCENSYMYKLEDINLYNPKEVGWFIQGDGGAEVHAKDVYIGFSATNFTGGYGIEYSRTTATDRGGYYFNNVLVVKNSATGATSKGGWYLHSTVPKTVMVLNLLGGGADGYLTSDMAKDVFAMDIKNIVNFKITNTWITSIRCDGVEDYICSDTNNPYGITLVNNGIINAQLSNINVAEGTFINYIDTAISGGIWYENVRAKTLTNDFNKLFESNKNKSFAQYSSRTYSDKCFNIVNLETPSKKTYLRTLDDGTFEFLNSNFSSTLQIDSAGRIKRSGATIINTPKVFSTPTGNEYRTQFDTSTVTLQQLAGAYKALITDLRTWHGLFTNE